MTHSVVKQLAGHLMIGSLSVFLALVIFEGVLTIALPGKDELGVELDQTVNQPQNEEPFVAAAPLVSERAQVIKDPVCGSDFYAVFDANPIQICVRNPTPLMAHWGPPSPAWFRSLGGEFRSQRADAAPPGLCACLAEQHGYKTADGTPGPSPINHILFENTQRPIAKWVCGDPCVTVAKGESHES